MKTIFFAAALLIPTAIHAADMPVKAPPPPAVYNWTGFYIGGNVGGGWGHRDVDFSANDPSARASIGPNQPAPLSPPASVAFDVSGAVGGAQIGYNIQVNPRWLVGLEADIDAADIKGAGLSTGVHAATIPYTLPIDEHVKWFGTVRGRLGFLPAPNLLAYVTGGFAYGRIDHSGSWSNNSAGFFILNIPAGGGPSTVCGPGVCWAGSSSNTVSGWTVGGGLEYALWQHWTIRAEYLYLSLDNKPLTQTQIPTSPLPAGGTPSTFNSNYSRANLNIARVGLSYKF